jgi:probable HAF family extracellular repeat protein
MFSRLILTAVLLSVFPGSLFAASFLQIDSIFEGAYDMSDDGTTIVGYANGYQGQNLVATRWRNGQIDFLGSENSFAFATSADGSVVVGDSGLAFRWENGNLQYLVSNPGEWNSANAVSSNGQFIAGSVGSSGGINTSYQKPCYWDNDGLHVIENFGFATEGYATAISNDGQIIIGSSGDRAFKWQNGVMNYLGDVPGGIPAQRANGMSSDGSVIVGDGFRWENGVMTALEELYGSQSQAQAVSGDGSIIVGSSGWESYSRAFIWDEIHGVRDLNWVLVNEYGLDLGGWTLRNAIAISEDGTKIFGGTGYSGYWIAEIPEPATVLFLSLGGWTVSRRRRC